MRCSNKVSGIYSIIIIVTLEMIVQVLQCAAPYLNTMSESPYITWLKITFVCLSHIPDLNHIPAYNNILLHINNYFTLIIIV